LLVFVCTFVDSHVTEELALIGKSSCAKLRLRWDAAQSLIFFDTVPVLVLPLAPH
jgi:hypothetical protein